jgi:hypothetical protein
LEAGILQPAIKNEIKNNEIAFFATKIEEDD